MNLTKMVFVGYDFDTDGDWYTCVECYNNIRVPMSKHSNAEVKYCPFCGRKIVEYLD